MKNVIITGCAKGLGLETSKMLADAGYNVLGISRTPTEEYQQLQANNPKTVFFYQFDFAEVKVNRPGFRRHFFAS
ncbi:hypothetical protein AXW18_13595 [Yersinia ruckeri]|uniref:SDR family NAD(P)-dependent oxidoreductase n=1 Tax=Yersinia ruckeri TaxID=29486 RepID=UPI00091F60EC|nr:SDR family NAD(P)-dependent oxidoreductase [Yersinia ruckeri]OIX34136.1 hypothetical protein AXW18_13595 [Yersinia ruckeri]